MITLALHQPLPGHGPKRLHLRLVVGRTPGLLVGWPGGISAPGSHRTELAVSPHSALLTAIPLSANLG